ncbi:hypothetical protein ACFQJ7_04850 [Halovenus rubra]|uniref:Uncharacterized protein n=2 Tax=Halovenus rubra TaxID=869890 RepID=A0ACC7DXP9_9EURY|nr:hypothetical protein [Halovenus rubra]
MQRRQYLAALTAASTGLFAGCIGGDDSNDDSNGSESEDDDTPTEAPTENTPTPEPTETAEPTETPDNNEPDDASGSDDETKLSEQEQVLAVVDSYLNAIKQKNIEEATKYLHASHPYNLSDEDMEAQLDQNLESYDSEIVDSSFDTEDITKTDTIEFWFQNTDKTLSEVLEGEEVTLVEITMETTTNGETNETTFQNLVLTEDGDWKIFLPYQKPADVPGGKPVDNEKYQIIDGVEFDREAERARINISGAGDIEAKELVAYSASLQEESTVWSKESDTLPSVNYFTTIFDPTGDEIVVTLRLNENEEVVIHREQYKPESGTE